MINLVVLKKNSYDTIRKRTVIELFRKINWL